MTSPPKLKYRIKNLDKVLIVVALVGTIFIATCDYFLWFDLSANTKVSSIILWLTAIVIIKYTIETYDLRVTTEKEVRVQEEIMMNEFLPIVAPFDGMLQNKMLRINLRNAGRGLAKNVEIKLNDRSIISGLSIFGGDGITREFHLDEISRITANQRNNDIAMEIRYQDIYNREFTTRKCVFYRDEPEPRNRFQLKEGAWRFEKIT